MEKTENKADDTFSKVHDTLENEQSPNKESKTEKVELEMVEVKDEISSGNHIELLFTSRPSHRVPVDVVSSILGNPHDIFGPMLCEGRMISCLSVRSLVCSFIFFDCSFLRIALLDFF